MTWKDNINTVKEIYPGHYQIILDFATNAFLDIILNDEFKYVWVMSHKGFEPHTWNNYSLPIFSNQTNQNILARQIVFDFIAPVAQFKELLPKLRSGIKLVQLNNPPAYYLSQDTPKGRTRYDMLTTECDYLFEIDIPSATDYGRLISSNKAWLEALLSNPNIDWNNLP